MFRNYFAWFKHHPNQIYFDSSATTIKPDWINQVVKQRLTPELLTKIYTQTTQKLAQFLGCAPINCFYTSGATYVSNFLSYFLANQVGANDQILLTYFEHSSNILPWIRLAQKTGAKLAYAGNDNQTIPRITEADLLRKVTKNTKIISFANKTNLTGQVLDLKRIVAGVRAISPNCCIIVDATQYFVNGQINCVASGADFIFGSAHKIYGPHGIGFFYSSNRYLLELTKPQWHHWFLHQNNYLFNYQQVDFHALLGFGDSLDFYLNNYQQIKIHEAALCQYLIDNWPKNTPFRYLKVAEATNLFLIKHPTIPSKDIAAYLDHHGIIVRSGWSCAYLAKKVLVNGDFFRLSINFLNEFSEIKYFLKLIDNFNPELDLFNFV